VEVFGQRSLRRFMAVTLGRARAAPAKTCVTTQMTGLALTHELSVSFPNSATLIATVVRLR
jgi:hypothetical protein